MSIFRKKVKTEPISPAVEDFNSNPPISGGNAYETRFSLKAQDLINKNTIPKLRLDKYKVRLNELSYNFYWLLQFHANYFVSIFPVKTESPELNKLIYECFRIHFMYGNCGIYKKGDLLLGLYEKKVHTNKLGEITKIEFQNIFDLLAAKDVDSANAVDICLVLDKEELDKSYARLRTTSIGFGAIVTWLPFIKQQESLLKKIYMYSFVFHRKIAYKAQDLSTSGDELDAFFNEDVPFYVELDADMGTGNRFSTEGISHGTSGGVNELIDFYNFFVQTYYHLLGRRNNVDTKKERNITSEVNASQSNFDTLHIEDRICKEDFLNRVKEITGISWTEIKEEPIDDSLRDNQPNNMNRDSRDKE